MYGLILFRDISLNSKKHTRPEFIEDTCFDFDMTNKHQFVVINLSFDPEANVIHIDMLNAYDDNENI